VQTVAGTVDPTTPATMSRLPDPPDPYRLRQAGTEALDALKPLWLAVHAAHRTSMPDLAPYVEDAVSWRERRKLYDELLRKPDTLLLLAHDQHDLVGYGLAHVARATDTWIGDTWATGERIGEIESLSVAPAHRGRGLGDCLLRALQAHLRAQGIEDLIIGLLPGNRGALRLYERHGYRPTWTYLSRFHDRPPPR
jgi:ribosomal protein S18 acetylase RimI-like enzyme